MADKRIYLCLAHMSEAGLEQKYIQEAFDTNWVVPLEGRGTGTCPNLKKAKSKRVSTRGCRSAFVCIFWQGLARQKILPFQNYFVSLQSEMEYLTSSIRC